MKALNQLLRQSLKTIAGILTIALAVAILISAAGQFSSTILTKNNLSDSYSTVALISDKYYWTVSGTTVTHSYEIPDDDTREWVKETIQNRNDLILGESFTEVYSAYAPQLSPDLFSKHEFGYLMGGASYLSGNPYRCAMLEITMTAVGTLRGEAISSHKIPGGDWQDYREYLNIVCVGTVENVIGLEKGFPSPVGKTIAITIKAYDEEALKDMELGVGQRYLIYGMDYSDVKDDILSGEIQPYASLYEEIFGPATVGEDGPEYDEILEQIACHLTVFDVASLPVTQIETEGFVVYPDLRYYNYMDEGMLWTNYVPAEEVVSKYTLPTVAKLDGTAEDYLSSDNGALWRQMLNNLDISNHGFPVFAVDKLGYQMAFVREEARIVDGRDFTEKERTEGAKVCILSESLAMENGLSVGDTLSLQTYGHDYNMGSFAADLFKCSSFPNAGFYSHNLGFTSEMEEYEIVGIYRQNNAWENVDDPYGFTPNTIFVPKGSITGDARTGTKGIFYTLVLHNGKMEELQELQNEAGYPDLFLCFDQGYSDIVEALSAYEGVSEKAFYIGIAGCAVIMLLFLVLFPLQQGRNLSIMSSLGAPRGKRIGFVVGSSLGILLPGVVLGGTAGALLWKQVAAKLMESVNVLIPMNADTVVLSVSISVALLVTMLLAVTLIAIAISGDKGLSKRR